MDKQQNNPVEVIAKHYHEYRRNVIVLASWQEANEKLKNERREYATNLLEELRANGFLILDVNNLPRNNVNIEVNTP